MLHLLEAKRAWFFTCSYRRFHQNTSLLRSCRFSLGGYLPERSRRLQSGRSLENRQMTGNKCRFLPSLQNQDMFFVFRSLRPPMADLRVRSFSDAARCSALFLHYLCWSTARPARPQRLKLQSPQSLRRLRFVCSCFCFNFYSRFYYTMKKTLKKKLPAARI